MQVLLLMNNWKKTFNRTNVELKLGNGDISLDGVRTFNRTNVELKWYNYLRHDVKNRLLIVPMWN